MAGTNKKVNLTGNPPLQLRIAFFKGPDGELIEIFQNDQTRSLIPEMTFDVDNIGFFL